MIISSYQITERIAEASQAVIYKAYHKKKPQRPLVLKIFKSTGPSAYMQAQFRQRIEQLKVLNDPLLITPLTFGVNDGVCYMTYDYFNGVTLQKLTETRTVLTLPVFFKIACDLARALDIVHEAGIIHGGIKPHNILVNPDTLDVRLIDFISTLDVRSVSHFIYDYSFVRGTLSLLEYCACLGNTFSPAELALIIETTLQDILSRLQPALRQGLLIENKNQLQFIHDKVQEAALSAIPAGRRRRIHWRVGNLLLAAAKKSGDAVDMAKLENLFTIVSHLNLGRGKNLDARTAYLLSDLNYHAGNKALEALATEAANRYFTLSRELLPDDCWEDEHYERTFRIYQKAAKTELMCGNYEQSEKLLNLLLDHAKTDLDKAECLAEQATSLSSIGNFIKAIETANRGLAFFNKAIPDNAEEANRKRKKLMKKISSLNIDIWETIANMPFTTDRKSKIELTLYSELIPDLYMSGAVPQLYLSAVQSTEHCLAGGMDESVIYSFSIMGLQLGEEEKFEQAFKYEGLARNLSAKYPNTFGATRGMNGVVWCNMHSRSHPREIVEYCLKSIQCGKNCGDLYNAGLSYGPLMWNLQVQGADLAAIEDYARECLEFANKYHLSFSVGLAEAMQAGWIDPMKKNFSPVSMEERIKAWERDNHIASAGSYYVLRAITHYYWGEYEQTRDYLAGVKRYLSGLTDNVLKRQWHVFLVLNALKLYEKGLDFRDKRSLLTEIRPVSKKIEKWAALGPLLKPYLSLVYAELERVTGEFKEARSLYLDAINAAHEQQYTLLEGHLYECLGELLCGAGQCMEKIYFAEAARLYRKCRAERKESLLLEKYPEYFVEPAACPAAVAAASAGTLLPDLDTGYLMKSSLAIAAEIELDALMKKIMNVVIECSGAQHGYLLIEDNGRLFVRAESHIGEEQAVQTVNRQLDDVVSICKAIVRYVYRTGERVILSDAAQDEMFKDHPEVRRLQLRSVLCLPVIKQTKMIGLLYLENRLADAVFIPEKTQMLELLMSQAAISLENSRFVEEMKKADEWVKKSLSEKEVLLQEIHHRVKNNLQIIQSMLNLQLPYIKNEQACEMFKESRNRIFSMALIHEKLYQSKSLATIDLAEYIRNLTANLYLSYGVNEQEVRLEVNVDNVVFDLNTVIPCALIINELASNALKHAFPEAKRRAGGNNRIFIDLCRTGDRTCRLTVSDSGAGLPEGFSIQNCQSLGLKLVNVLVKQLKGSVDLRTNGCTEFIITFAA